MPLAVRHKPRFLLEVTDAVTVGIPENAERKPTWSVEEVFQRRDWIAGGRVAPASTQVFAQALVAQITVEQPRPLLLDRVAGRALYQDLHVGLDQRMGQPAANQQRDFDLSALILQV